MAKQGALVVASLHTGRPKDEEPHVKQYTKNKKEIIEYVSMMLCEYIEEWLFIRLSMWIWRRLALKKATSKIFKLFFNYLT